MFQELQRSTKTRLQQVLDAQGRVHAATISAPTVQTTSVATKPPLPSPTPVPITTTTTRRADVIESTDDGAESEPVRDVRCSTDTAELRALMREMRAALQVQRKEAHLLRNR